MNETFAKILEFSLIFWLLLGLFATVFGYRMQTYIISDDGLSTIQTSISYENLGLLTGVSVLYDVMTFRLTEQVPIWLTYALNLLFILTGVSIIMALSDR